MERTQLIKELIDFFNSRGRFKVRNSYTGMLASAVDELFAEYFDSLEIAEKSQMVVLIVDGVIGQCKELKPRLGEVIHLLLSLCIRGYIKDFESCKEELEREFNNAKNLEFWIKIEKYQDYLPLPSGINYKKDWHYPLILGTILLYLKSDKIEGSYNYLIENANSESFRAALSRNRKEVRGS